MSDIELQSGAVNKETARVRREFARRLKLVRVALGFKGNRDFAAFLGMVENTVGAYQLGIRFPSPPELVKIKRKTGYTIDFLYADDRDGLTGSQRRELDKAEKRLKDEEGDEG